MFAIIRVGGKQYRVENGTQLLVDRLHIEEGSAVEGVEVLMLVDGDDTQIGTPTLEIPVGVTALRHQMGKKIRVFKYKAKKNYRRRIGSRPHHTLIRVDSINGNSERAINRAAKAVETAPAAPATPAVAAAPAPVEVAPVEVAPVEVAPVASEAPESVVAVIAEPAIAEVAAVIETPVIVEVAPDVAVAAVIETPVVAEVPVVVETTVVAEVPAQTEES